MSIAPPPGLTPELLAWAQANRPAEEVARLVELAEQEAVAESYIWERAARAEQLEPEGDWLVWLLITGRRWGKTRSAAEWLRKRALETVGAYAICAPTYGDVRDVCVEGGFTTPANRRSGFMSVCAPGEVANYNRSLGEIVMSNGSKIKMLSADEPDRARGWGFNAAWCDEMSSWRYPATWYETLLPATTMDDKHRFVLTTTPKPNVLTKALVKRAQDDPGYVLVRGRSMDNQANLGSGAIEELRSQLTERLARQELEGELLLDVAGAVATYEQLEAGRRKPDQVPELTQVLVSVDPAVTNTADSDETGISVLGRGIDDHCYYLADESCRLDVDDWARRAVAVAVENNAGLLLYEKNQGHDTIGSILKQAMTVLEVKDLVITDVNAEKSKWDRALSLQQWVQQERFHLVGSFPELEDQLTSFTADHKGKSPDRADSCVHGFRKLMLETAKPKPKLRFHA